MMVAPDPDAIQEFISILQCSFPSINVAKSTFSSGGIFIDVRLNQRARVLMYSPHHDCYGIDELRDDDGYTTGYKYAALSFDEASRILLELLQVAYSSGGENSPGPETVK